MMMMYDMMPLFVSLALGYILCILAKKQDGLLKTVGYTLGGSILVLSLAFGALSSQCKMGHMNKMGKMGKYMGCHMPKFSDDMPRMK